MKLHKSYIILVFILITALFYGCIDDPVGKEGTVEGTVYDPFGYYNRGVFVSIGDYPIVSTDIFGKFSLENSIYPYNLTVTDKYSYSNKYIGLTLPNPQVYTLEGNGYPSYCSVDLFFPEIKSIYEQAIVKFISKDNSTQEDYIVEGGLVKTCWINFMNGTSRIEGKFIFLQYTINDYSGIVSYDKFGVKEVVLNAGYSNQNIIFTEEDVNYNPNELYSYFNVQLANNFDRQYSRISMCFPEMHNNSTIQLPMYYNNSSGNIVLPDIPGLSYNVKFKNYAASRNSLIFSEKWTYIQPGQNVTMAHNKYLSLQQPTDHETNVNDNTKFIFEDTSPGGIYVYVLLAISHHDFHTINIVTDKCPLEFKDFKTWGYNFRQNTEYFWGVKKYPGYKNINDFTSSNILSDTLSTEIPASECFYFTTK